MIKSDVQLETIDVFYSSIILIVHYNHIFILLYISFKNYNALDITFGHYLIQKISIENDSENSGWEN